MNVLSVTITASGRRLAERLPFETRHGELVETVRTRWTDVDGFVLFAATGIAVRAIAPLLGAKERDPAVVCVDEAGRWAIPVCGGHAGGANRLATEVAGLIGAQAVLTTATDAAGMPALDALSGFGCTGDVARVTRALLDGEAVAVDDRCGWPLPKTLTEHLGGTSDEGAVARLVVDYYAHAHEPGVAVLHPPALMVGLGASTGAPIDDMTELVARTLAEAGLAPASVGAVATLDRKRAEPAIVAVADRFGVPVVDFPAEVLSGLLVPNPSETVRSAVGTASVAEAAALAAAGPGGELLATKQRSATATVAVARRPRPAGRLFVVGLGPGAPRHRTPAASAAVRSSSVVIGYGPYVDLAADAIAPGADVIRSPIGDEIGRSALALERAAAGERVALVCSGDAGVYALATLVFELAPGYPALDPVTDVEVIPGVTAALTSAAALGAPLGHDHVAISLSDLLTPWPVIERRLRAAAEADLVVSVYNPRSAGRDWQLGAARDLLAAHRPAGTPVGVVTDAGRPGQQVIVTTIAEFDPAVVGMTTCVVFGSSSTRLIGGRMVTPRGYHP